MAAFIIFQIFIDMKKIFGFIFGFILLSCTPKVIESVEMGSVMKNAMKGKYSMSQFDSMCIADTLPQNLSDWKFLGLKDYETCQKNALFLYMKTNGKHEVMYKVEETLDDSVKITKRIITD